MIGEADYVFPLPKGAAFRDLKLSIDSKIQSLAYSTLKAAVEHELVQDTFRRFADETVFRGSLADAPGDLVVAQRDELRRLGDAPDPGPSRHRQRPRRA
mgnify:CR=1 FL=1